MSPDALESFSHHTVVSTSNPLKSASDTARSEGGITHAKADPFSARSKFLRVLGKFKNKHMSPKRPSNSCNDDASETHASPPFLADRSDTMTRPVSDSHSVSMKSYMGHKRSEETAEDSLQDIVMEDSGPNIPVTHNDRSGSSSSLRVKLKNRVNHTLASIKSSSNLREQAHSQQVAATDSAPVPASTEYTYTQPRHQPQRLQSSMISTVESQQNSPKTRQAKAFWSFPRLRPDPTGAAAQSRHMPWGFGSRPNSMAEPSATHVHTSSPTEQDTVMLSPELAPHPEHQPFGRVAEDNGDLSSEDSIDIIMPSDYDDYTQFAELPLKKRKKMLAAAAANASSSAADSSGMRPQASRMNSDAMRRLLLQRKPIDGRGKKNKDKNKGGSEGDQSFSQPQLPEDDISAADNLTKRNSKKRPKDQDSIEQKRQKEPNKMAKSNSDDLPEWRKAIMRSLHFGRGNNNQAKRKSKDSGISNKSMSTISSPVESTGPGGPLSSPPHAPQQQQRDNVVYPEDQDQGLRRTESIQSVRSRTMATSTHAGLLATTFATPRGSVVARRETLEMAMRRRRRTSAATRSSIFGGGDAPPLPPLIPVPGSVASARVDDDNASTNNITHTFTSFTLELADIYHAHAIVNKSATPGLFNFKRQPRFTMSSVNVDTDQEFKSFDSDGDAMSGYTGDADVSMEEIFVRPKTPVTSKVSEGRDKGKAPRTSGGGDILTRRRMSSLEGDSDTVPELPVLTIRTRDLNRSGSSGSGQRLNNGANSNGRESPRSPKRAGSSSSPTLNRKPTRNLFTGSPIVTTATTLSASPTNASSGLLSLEDVVSWKPRNILPPARPTVPALNTRPMLPTSKGSGLSSSTTLISSSRTPYSATSTLLTQSPGFISPTMTTSANKNGRDNFHHHRQQSSSSHQRYPSHYQQASSDTLIPHHLKNFSTASTMSASSGYSAQTLTANSPLTAYQYGQLPHHRNQPVVEFDPSKEFPPTTPVDLKAMDFDTLLKTAEQEQRKGHEEMTLKKKKTFHNLNQQQHQQQQQQQQQQQLKTQRSYPSNYQKSSGTVFDSKPLNTKSGLSVALSKSASSTREEHKNSSTNAYKNIGSSISSNNSNSNHSNVDAGSFIKHGRFQFQTGDGLDLNQNLQPQQQQQHRQALRGAPLRITIPKPATAFDSSDAIIGATGAARNNPRSKRVMKKKMSVIKLSGNVQGRREDDGMIRVSVATSTRASS
ncbi:hypothetical protein BGX28_002847 [Mortierella sp. GBA30]|nr:hypothetical protein BGX28_002847 [Mortierella sp. GBA30]